MVARAFLRYTLMILSILFLLLAAGCTFYSEEIIEPVVPDEGEPDSPDEPDVPPVPSEYPSARYYYDLLIEKYGDMSEGYKAGDRIKANIYDYHYGDITVSGSFSAVVLDPSDIEVEQAILLLDDNPVIVDNGIVQSGESAIEEIQSIVKDYMDNLVDTGFSEYSSDYFLIAREAGGDSIQANDSSGAQKSYAVRSFKAIREKQENDSYTSALAVQFILDGDEPIWIEAETNTGSIIENWKCRFYSIGSYHEGEPGRLSIPAGAEYIPSAAFISDIIVGRYGDGSDEYKDGDRIKAVINTPFFHQGTGKSIKGGFEVEISGDSVYVEAASLLVDDERITVIGGEIVDGSLDINTIQKILLSYCVNFHESQFKSGTSDYFLFEREMSEPLLLNAVFDEEWVMRWCSLDSYRIVREKQEGNAFDSDIAIRISLSDGSGYSVEIELSGSASKLGKDVVYYKLGSQEEGSPSDSIIKGPENQPDGMYYYNLLVSKFGDGSDGYREGDKFWGIIPESSYHIESDSVVSGHFEATVEDADSSSFAVNVDSAVLEINDELIRIENGTIVQGSSSVSMYLIENIVISYMQKLVDSNFSYYSLFDYFLMERCIENEKIYAFDSSWDLSTFNIDSMKVIREQIEENTFDSQLGFLLDLSGNEDIIVEAENGRIMYSCIGNHAIGNPGNILIEGPSTIIDAQYYLDKLADYGINGSMLNYKSGDSVSVEFSNYFYERTGDYITGTITAEATATDLFIESADFTFGTSIGKWNVTIEDNEVSYSGNGASYTTDFLYYAKDLVSEARISLDSSEITGFSQIRDLSRGGATIRLKNEDYITRDYIIEELTLTRVKNNDVIMSCHLACGNEYVLIETRNGSVYRYQQG